MTATTIRDVEAALQRKYTLCEALFKAGEMERAVRELYTEDIYYLTGDLRLLRGRAALTALFTSIQAQIAEVHVDPVLTYGDPNGTGVVYQFCNTTRHMTNSGEVGRAHYIAAFRRVDDDWLCEMEVPALGWISTPVPAHVPA